MCMVEHTNGQDNGLTLRFLYVCKFGGIFETNHELILISICIKATKIPCSIYKTNIEKLS